MTESLYTSQTPSGGLDDLSDLGVDGVGGTTATTVIFAASGTVTHIRFFSTVTVSGTYTGELWQVTNDSAGTLLGSKAVAAAGISSAGWNTIAFDTPISVTAGVAYRCALHNTNGNYVARTNTFTSAVVNGNITGIQDNTNPNPPNVGTLHNGTFKTDSAAGAYPGTNVNPASYLVDVVFSGGGNVDGSGTSALTATATGAAQIDRNQSGTRSVAATIVGAGQVIANASGTLSLSVTRANTESLNSEAVPQRVANSSGWYQALDIWREAKQVVMDDAAQEPQACPNDGQPLLNGPEGQLFCPWDGWQPH